MTLYDILFKDATLRFAAVICFIGFSGFMAWSALAPLAEGVIAPGRISVEDNRKIIQHLEGGIIDAIHVDEGDWVEAGDALLTLTDVAAESGREELAQELVTAWLASQRLTALLNGEASWQADAGIYAVPLENDGHDEIIALQQDLFLRQQQTFAADVNVLRQQRTNASRSAAAVDAQVKAVETERDLILSDLQLKRQLLEEKLTQADKVAQLERDLAALDVSKARLQAEAQSARLQADAISTQIAQTRASFRETINAELEVVRRTRNQVQERLEAAQDVVNRAVITAPQSGHVLNLKFFTQGGVVRAGEPIMEIVPRSGTIIALLELSPGDRDVVYEGLRVRTHLSGLNSWRAPVLLGEVITVSADLKTHQNGNYQYYEAYVELDPLSAEVVTDVTITPGMPVEGYIVSGHSRTLLEYLFEPITGTLRRSLPG